MDLRGGSIDMLLFGILLCFYVLKVEGHGRLVDPPSRASMWRYGFKTPHNYNDNQLFCGGVQNQWERHGGKCGVCGDPWQGPREHEAGGKYANGIVVQVYDPGETITVTVELTANHKGWFEFRICKNNNPNTAISQKCLDKNLLKMPDGETRFMVYGSSGYGVSQKFNIKLELPPDLLCTQCVLQWKYNAGNSWGTDKETGEAGIGYGAQEQFYGCADVAVGFKDVVSKGQVPKVYLCLIENEVEDGWYLGRVPTFDDETDKVCGHSSGSHTVDSVSVKTFVIVTVTFLLLSFT